MRVNTHYASRRGRSSPRTMGGYRFREYMGNEGDIMDSPDELARIPRRRMSSGKGAALEVEGQFQVASTLWCQLDRPTEPHSRIAASSCQDFIRRPLGSPHPATKGT